MSAFASTDELGPTGDTKKQKKRMNKIVCVFVPLAAVVTAQAGERLSNDELKSYYTDQTVNAVHFKLGPGESYFGSDGSVHRESDSGNERVGKCGLTKIQTNDA